ncbi:hypothetical protein MLD38_029791 [Melastoma candidum]|uniref:Uncharacterized protein n=1 Tax=Melastoma candidum TaxID=119954 RepID=A0ACB9N4T8_9MYRT|nr:hypothetical protein MLD38_029791 [Melastoma candidum]
MRVRGALLASGVLCLCFMVASSAKKSDPYKVLGINKDASQREIQKAFHKLSLQYHPDKNKNKGAQEKFSEINNAYEILSDEEKRKNYDLYGDEKGNPGLDSDNFGGQGGYSHFTGSGPGYSHFTGGGPGGQGFSHFSFSQGGQQSSGGRTFSFGGSGGQNPFGFGLNDIFSTFFGGSSFGSSGNTGSSRYGSGSHATGITTVSSAFFKKEIANQGMTWLLLFSTSSSKSTQPHESALEQVGSSLKGVLKVGHVNCGNERSLCTELGTFPRSAPKIFVYSYGSSDRGSLVEYSGELTPKDVKRFCQEHLPRVSKRVDLKQFEFASNVRNNLPSVMLLSTKKDTPAIWRTLSGLHRKRFNFFDSQVADMSDPALKKLGVDALPAVVGWLSNGDEHVLKTGISVKDAESAVTELSKVLDSFEKKNKKAASSQPKKEHKGSANSQIPLLTSSNFDALCGESTPLCIIGAFRSSKAREQLESVLSVVSRKTLSRQKSTTHGSGDSISYVLLDATKQSGFLDALDKSRFKSSDRALVAYKHRKGKFAVQLSGITHEEVERFVSSVLNGDVKFAKVRQKPVLR